MANERITENIVRQYIQKDELFTGNKIIVEEQYSENIKINKLLKNASKSGSGKGCPEFIIQFQENSNLIIIVECKANITKHKSQTLDIYKDYAVDGVLLYASFLSKEYDVLAIAVSGENKNKVRVSHFLQLKNTTEAHSIFNDDYLLPLTDYLNGYQTDERKFNQDFQGLLKYSKTLNDKLHSLKVKESERSLLISGTLIALTDKSFNEAYKYKEPKPLANYLVNTINEKLSNIQTEHIKDIISSYLFIKTHTILAKQGNKLKDIVDEIDGKINNFIKTYKYFDTLGQFYIAFLRYANNDKGLGIVLTPPHITELFCEISNINKDSVILDTCTGTGGFLISAMQKMTIDASGDKEKIKLIKEKQIVGVEFQHDIFSLLCSNMYIHGDGRSNLMKGSCFDDDIKKQVSAFNPNVGFLNPPYKTNKDDIEELEFVLNNLEQLEKGSYCVAIVPMSCALTNNRKNSTLKENLLRKHTLEALFSMPNELFYNSNVSVATCVLVFRSKEKHPLGYKTYFGIWNDDKFVKIKNIGRTDFYNHWDNTKRYWITNYQNKDEIIGHSIKKTVNAENEWCSEAYIEIDYKKTHKETFIEFLLNTSAICFY
ncbi:MAG: N-6 DNA methylase [Candidatus Zeuxoniibacter abyssi]|nr:MAG: N-6 DNA methylase [Candidatus Persebacteraceae bacterium AB1(2)]